MCWEVVVVIVVIIVVVVAAGVQNKKKKRSKKKCAPKATTSGPDVRVNSHVAAITVVIFTTKAFFSFFFLFLFRTNFYSFMCTHSCWLSWFTQFFNWYLVILHHRSFISNEYAHTRVSKAAIYYLSVISLTSLTIRRKKIYAKDKSLIVKYVCVRLCILI
jgi:hypothetical protein